MSLPVSLSPMTTLLLATTSVHTTAAACDYLGPRLSAADTVVVLGVTDPSAPDRDLGDAANVARARLVPATVETDRREGHPAEEILSAAGDVGADEIVVGRRRGVPSARGRPGLGTTAAAVAGTAARPVVVVPVET